MKLQAPYFGNRFANVLKKNAAKTSRKAKADVSSEMEALESRILLSGVGTGLNKKQVSFTDADGDKVLVKIQGRGASFDIDLGGLTNKADIANIDINGNGSLGIVVTPVGSFTKPVKTSWIYDPNFKAPSPSGAGGDSTDYTDVSFQGKIQTQYYNLTPGFTSIGSITAAGNIGSIGLNAAVVADINIQGNANFLNLSTGMVAKVDQFMATNNDKGPIGSYLPGYGGWNPGLGQIDFHNITVAGSVLGINISSGAAVNGNDYLGDITVGSLGRLTGINSQFDGQLTLTAPNAVLGSVVVAGWADGASIRAENNLTFNAAGFQGVLDVGGHLNLGIRGGNFDGTILAGNGISGLRSAPNDAIFITSAEVKGQILTSSGDISDIYLTNGRLDNVSIVSAGNIGDLLVGDGSQLANSSLQAANIGTISVWNEDGLGSKNSVIASGNLEGIVVRNSGLNGDTTFSVGGKIGLIDLSNGDLAANIAAGSFGDIILRGNGNLSGILKSTTGDIGSVTVHFGNITGTLSSAADIGKIAIEGGSLKGVVTAANDITSISANWLDAINTGSGIAGTASIHAGGDINAVNASSTNGSGIAANATIRAEGTIGSVTGVSYSTGADAGINAANLIANEIGKVTAIAVNGVGINGLTISSATSIASIAGSGLNGGIVALGASAGAGIGAITATTVNGVGLQTSRIVAGSIGSISATSDFGTGIAGVDLSATSGGITSIAGSGDTGGLLGVNITTAKEVGSVSGIADGISFSGSGLNNVSIVAGTSVGTIAGSSTSSNSGDAGINNNFVSAQTTIGTVTGTGTGASGILNSRFVSQSEDIGAVTGSSTGANGSGVGIGDGIGNTQIISMSGIVGDITGNASGDGFGLVDITISAQTNVSKVTGTSLFGTGIGEFVGESLVYAANGNIGAVTGSSLNATGNGDGINGLEVRSELGSITSITGMASDLTDGGGSGLVGLDVFAAQQGGILPLAISGSANGGNGISGGEYLLASGNMKVSGGTVTGSAIADGAQFEAKQGIVEILITATGKGANGINNASFTGASIAPITISLPSSQAEDAINQGTFTATTGNIGAVTITNNSTNGGSGIAGNSRFDAQTGNIGAVSVTMTGVGAGKAIENSTFQAVGDIASLTVNSTSTGVDNSSFTADREGNGVGNLGPIDVTVTGENASGITNGSAFSGASIGNIAVSASTALTNDAINGSTFEATAGNIGTITALANGADATDNAIESSQFLATGSIGAITATAKAGDALNAVTATADTDLSGTGDLSTITANSSTGNAIVGGAYTGNAIGDITASSTTGSAVNGAVFTATSANIGNIVATGAVFGFSATATAEQSIGNITATVTSDTTGNSAIAAAITATKGTIGNFLVTSAALASDVFTGTVNAGTGIGNIDITAATANNALSAKIDADTRNIWTLETPKPANFGQIGNITVTSSGDGSGIVGATVTAAEIGNVSVTLSSINALNAIAGSSFIADTQTESVINNGVYNNFGKIGNITVANATQVGTGNGIIGSQFKAGNAGQIGNVSVTMVGIDGLVGGSGIAQTTFDAARSSGTGTDDIFTSTIGAINVIHTGTGVAIGGVNVPDVSFIANEGVGAVTVVAQGTGMENVDINADADGSGTGSIGTVDVLITGTGGNGVIGGNWTGASIGNIEVDFTRADGGNGITGLNASATAGSIGSITVGATNPPTGTGVSGSNFAATVDIGTITVTAIADAIVNSNFTAGNNVSAAGITATSTIGDAIDSSSFTADNDGDAAGNVGNILATTATGSAITNGSVVSGANLGTITATVTGDGGRGISASTFTATAGNIGTIVASTAGTGVGDHAISGSRFTATNNIGAVSATALNGDGINGSTFTADSDTDDAGDVGNILAITTEGNAITTSVATGANLGTITATVTGDGGLGIENSTFTALAGNIGTIIASTAGTVLGDHAISGSGFTATNNIGAVSATALNGDGINASTFTADSDTDNAGDLVSITAETTTGNGITGSTFAGENIGPVFAKVTGATGGDAVQSSSFTANSNIGAFTARTAGTGSNAIDFSALGSRIFAGNDLGALEAKVTALDGGSAFVGQVLMPPVVTVGGNAASITINNASTVVAAHGLDYVKIDIDGTLGAVNITVAGGNAMFNSNIDPVSIASVNLTSTGLNSSVMLNSAIITTIIDSTDPAQTGKIGAIVLTANGGLGMENSQILAAGDITSINSNGGLKGSTLEIGRNSTLGSLEVNVTSGDAIENTTVTYVGKGDPLNTSASASIGTITVGNTGQQITDQGIVNSNFYAGSSGTGIGDIRVVVAGGEGIYDSEFIAETGSYTPNNTDVTDEGTFVAPISAYSVNNLDPVNSTAAPFPAGLTGDIGFSAALAHTRVDGNGGFTPWNSGGIWGDTTATTPNLYDGDVYVTSGNSVTLDLAPSLGDSSIGSIIFYVLGSNAGQDFTITLPGGETLNLTNVQIATAVEVSATDIVETGLSTITITTTNPGDTFGIGQFSVTEAAAPVPFTADIGKITVINTGVFVSSDGISNSDFEAADSIGNIDIQVGGTKGFPVVVAGGTGILNSGFNANAGNIGTIDVTNISTDIVNSFGMKSVIIDAAVNIGAITVVSVGDSITDSVGSETVITSGADMGAISLTSSEGSALSFANSNSVIDVGNNLTSFTAQSTAVTGDIDTVVATGIPHTALAVAGDISGNILITNASTNLTADAMQDVKFDIIGSVTGTTTVSAAGGAAMNNSNIDPVNMGAISLNGAMINNSIIVATGSIDSLTLTGDVEAGSSITAGSVTNATLITGDLAGSISSTVGSIGSVSVTGDAIAASISATTTIGNIDINGTNDQSLTLSGTAVGNVVFDNLDNGKGVTLTLGTSLTTIDDITAKSPGGSASNLYVTTPGMLGVFGLTNVGNITSDGNAQFTNHAKSVAILGDVSVTGTFTGGAQFGATGVGLRLGALNNGDITIDTAALDTNGVTFVIDNTTVVFALPGVLTQGVAADVTAPSPGPSTGTFGGVTFTLV